MDDFVEWALTAGLPLLADVVIPVAAILIPTIIAVWLARNERRAAIEDRQIEREQSIEDRHNERRLQAGAHVIDALAPLSSIQPDQPIHEHLWRLRSAISVYRAWIHTSDRSGDWLALRHREGMHLWSMALQTLAVIGGPERVSEDGLVEITRPAHVWAGKTTEMFSGFLSGHVPEQTLLEDGARLLGTYPQSGEHESSAQHEGA